MTHPLLAQFRADARGILADQGRAAVYTPGGGEGVALAAMVSPGAELAGGGPQGLGPEKGYTQGRWAVVLVHADDLAQPPEQDVDSVTVDGETYTVRQAQRCMGGALWRLWCSADERGGWRR